MKLRFLMILILLLAAVCAFAQTPSASGPAMHVRVVVTDNHHASIHDLTAGDFAVEMGGKAQSVLSAQVPAAMAASDLPSGTFGNVNLAANRGPIVIVFDAIHTRYSDERPVRKYLLSYLASAAEKDVPVSVLVMSPSGLQSFHDYTTSSATLAAALRALGGQKQSQAPNPTDSTDIAAETARLQKFLDGAGSNNIAGGETLRTNVNAILGLFHSVADAVSGIPGHKTLVWITGVVPFAVDKNTKLVSSPLTYTPGGVLGNIPLTNPHESGVRIVAPEALISDRDLKRLYPLWQGAMDALFRAGVAVVPVAAGDPAKRSSDQMFSAMQELAALTGGREVHGLSDPFDSLRDLLDQDAGTYDLVLPQQASPCKSDKSEWCALRITVKRQGAQVSAPGGFFRSVHPDKDEAKNLQDAALASPLEYTGVPFMMRWTSLGAAGSNRKVGFAVRVEPDSGVIDAARSEVDLQIAVRAVPLAGGDSGRTATFTAGGKLQPDALQQISKQGLVVNNALELPPGQYQIKIVVHDNLSGKMGSVTVPLDVS
jgi:VWFA-related protein